MESQRDSASRTEGLNVELRSMAGGDGGGGGGRSKGGGGGAKGGDGGRSWLSYGSHKYEAIPNVHVPTIATRPQEQD